MATVREALLHPLRYRFRKDSVLLSNQSYTRGSVLAGVLIPDAFLAGRDPDPHVEFA